MKIGIEPENYNGIIAIDVDDDSPDRALIANILFRAKTCDRSEVDIIIKVKEDKNKNKTNE